LLEILLVVGIIAILAGIVIVAINPSKQLATVRNTERKSDLKQVSNAITQYYIDNFHYPTSLTSTLTEICDTGANASSSGQTTTCTNAGLINLSELVPVYLTAIPKDPSATTTNHAGYQVVLTSNKIGLSAPAELGQTITIGTVVEVVADACGTPGDATDANCWSDEASNKAYGPLGTNTAASESTVLSNGKTNTAALYALGSSYVAAHYCYTLEEDGMPQGTWYLPSYAELWAGYNAPAMSGGFPSDYYWSSTEALGNPDNYAWYLDSNGYMDNIIYKNVQLSVRCLR
jgi:type II secretory pathway pseudopilin PulG